MKIKDIKANATEVVECAILRITEGTAKNGAYLNITVCDGEKNITAKMFKQTLEGFKHEEGEAVFVTLNASVYNDALSYIVKEITASSSDPSQFLMSAPLDKEEMFNFLCKMGSNCGVYAHLVKSILEDNKERFIVWGAAKSVHHNIRSGLLYHTYRMVKSAIHIANLYNKEPSMLKVDPPVPARNINTGLLVAGAILHDIGKLWELNTSNIGDSEYTPMGVLMGHLFIGAELIGKYAEKENMNEEDKILLQHMILSHHGKYEYQAVALPAIPEAQLLHYIDQIDATMYQFEVARNELSPGMLSDRVFGLGGRVYCPNVEGFDSH